MTTSPSLLPTLSLLNDEVDKLLSHEIVQATWQSTVVSMMARLTPSKTPQQTEPELVWMLQTPSVLIPQQGTEDFPEVFMCQGFLYIKEDVFSDMSDIILKEASQGKVERYPNPSLELKEKVQSIYLQQKDCHKLSKDDFEKKMQLIDNPKTQAHFHSLIAKTYSSI